MQKQRQSRLGRVGRALVIAAALAYSFPSLLWAQSVIVSDRELLKNVQENCENSSTEAASLQHCSEYLARAHCLALYAEDRGRFEQSHSVESLFAFYQAGEKHLAILKCPDILKQRYYLERLALYPQLEASKADSYDLVKAEWERIVRLGKENLPEQQLFLCQELSYHRQFERLKDEEPIRNFLKVCVDSARQVEQLDEESWLALERILELVPELQTPETLFLQAYVPLAKQQYHALQSFLGKVKPEELSPQSVEKLTQAFLDHSPYLTRCHCMQAIHCVPELVSELPESVKNRLSWLSIFMHVRHALRPHLMDDLIPLAYASCRAKLVAQALGLLYLEHAQHGKAQELIRQLFARLHTDKNFAMIAAISEMVSGLPHQARERFSQEYGRQLTELVLEYASTRSDDDSLKMLEESTRFAPEELSDEVRVRLGLVLKRQNKNAEALRQWNIIIDKESRSSWRQMALILSIQTLSASGSEDVAEGLEMLLLKEYPNSLWVNP